MGYGYGYGYGYGFRLRFRFDLGLDLDLDYLDDRLKSVMISMDPWILELYNL